MPRVLRVLSTLLLLSLPTVARAQGSDSARALTSGDLNEWVTPFLEDRLSSHQIPGAALVVVRGGEVLLIDSYGFANPEAGIPFTTERTVFDIASVTKLFTYLGVMQLVEEGRIRLADPVNSYLSAYTVPERFDVSTTVEHLLLHTEGFEEALLRIATDGSDGATPTMSTEAFLLSRPVAQTRIPGTLLTYGSQATIVAAYLIEEVTGQSFSEYVDERLFGPLAMDRSTLVQPVPPELRSDVTPGFIYDDGRYRPHPNMFWHVPAAGGMSSTAENMSHLLVALTSGGRYAGQEIITPQTLRKMFQTGFRSHPNLPGSTYGFLEYWENGQRMVRRDGNAPATMSRLAVLPEADLAWFLVYNADDDGALRNAFDTAFLDRYFPSATQRDLALRADARPRGTPVDLRRFEGLYRMMQFNDSSLMRLQVWFAGQLTVEADSDSTLTIRASGFGDAYGGFEGTTRLRRIGPDLFERIEEPGRVAFHDENGEITRLYSGSGYLGAYYRLPWYERGWFHLGVASVVALTFLSTIGWVGRPSTPSRLLRWTLRWNGAASMVGLVVLAGAIPAVFLPGMTPTGFPGYIYEVSPVTRGLLTVGLLLIPLAVGQLVLLALLWRRRAGSIWLRVHTTLVTTGSVLLLWQAAFWNLLGYQF